jgi:hypothetical protein
MQTAWDAVTSAVSTAWSAISAAVQSGVQSVVDSLSNVGAQFAGIGQAIVDGIGQGISAGWSYLTNLVSNLAQQLFAAAKAALGIGSPSKLFHDEIGKMISEGMAGGIEANAYRVHGALDGLLDWVRGRAGDISDTVNAAGADTSISDTSTSIPAPFQFEASKLTGPTAPYITHPNYDFDALYNYLYPPPPPPPPPTPPPTGGGGGHGHHGGHGGGSGGWDVRQLQDAFRDALHDVFSGGIRTDVDYNSLTLRLNQVTRLNARR